MPRGQRITNTLPTIIQDIRCSSSAVDPSTVTNLDAIITPSPPHHELKQVEAQTKMHPPSNVRKQQKLSITIRSPLLKEPSAITRTEKQTCSEKKCTCRGLQFSSRDGRCMYSKGAPCEHVPVAVITSRIVTRISNEPPATSPILEASITVNPYVWKEARGWFS